MDMTTALVKSINTVPVKMYLGRDGLQPLGGDKLVKTARDMGITSDMVVNPPMVLGSNGVTVLEMASGYGTFMTGGKKLNRYGFTQILDTSGNILFDIREDVNEPPQVLKETTVAAMNKMMAQIPEWGTAKRAALNGIRAAGKTGTTQAYRDAWFVGYTGNYVSAVWFGNDNYQPTRRLTGGRLPAMTWQKFMTYAHQNIELRPIPYIDNPLPGKTDAPEANVEVAEEEIETQPLRPKLLSKKSEENLRGLENIFQNTKPLKLTDELASSKNSGTAIQ